MLLLPLADAALLPPAALARDATYALDIAALPIGASLAALSSATGASIGFQGALPAIRAPAVRGRMTVREALSRLLAGSGLVAVRIGTGVFRIERVPKPAPKPMRPARGAAPRTVTPVGPAEAQDIVVTGQKRPQALAEVPMSMSVVRMGEPSLRVASDTRDVALSTEGLALTNLGPGRNRLFIRGVADSPFSGPSQSTVAVQIDEARLTFDAPDPNLQLVDMERIEILKGPQGPLYGSGALGGIFHLVTRKPDLTSAAADVRVLGEAVGRGGLGVGAEAVANVPLVAGSLAVRAVGYSSRAAGWIDRVGGRRDTNVARTRGGRLALRWLPAEDWLVDLGGVLQYIDLADSQYVSSAARDLARGAGIAEPSDNDLQVLTASVAGRIGGSRLLLATSYAGQSVGYRLDASASASQLRVAAPVAFDDDHAYTVFSQEVRLSQADGGRWLGGVSYLRATSHDVSVLSGPDETSVPLETLDRVVEEFALFGEAKLALGRRADVTAGLRAFHTVAEDEAVEREGRAAQSVGKTVLAPSLAFSFAPPSGGIVFLRYARSVRPGGLAPSGETTFSRFDADELGTLDVGLRRDLAEGRLAYAASLFHTLWTDVQSDYLLPNGLVATRNAGRARIVGGEASLDWAVRAGTRVSAGLTIQDARLIRTTEGLELEDRRLPVTPDVNARAGLRHDFRVGAWSAQLSAQGNYVGRSRLTFDGEIDRAMGGYATASAGLAFTKEGLRLAVGADNLFDARGDTFAFGNPFSIRNVRQYTPLRPRTVTVSLARSW